MTGIPGSWQNHGSHPPNPTTHPYQFPSNPTPTDESLQANPATHPYQSLFNPAPTDESLPPNPTTSPYQSLSKPAPKKETVQPKKNYQDLASTGEGFGILFKASRMVWKFEVSDAVELVKIYNRSNGIWTAAFLLFSILVGVNSFITEGLSAVSFFLALVNAAKTYGYSYLYAWAVRRAHKAGDRGMVVSFNQCATSLALGYGVILCIAVPFSFSFWLFPEYRHSLGVRYFLDLSIFGIVALIFAIYAIYRSMLADEADRSYRLRLLIGYLIETTIMTVVIDVAIAFFILTPLITL